MRIINPNDGVGNFGRWLAYHIYLTGLPITEFAKDIGLCTATINNHIRKKCRPSITVVNMYCDYFGEGDIWRVYDALVADWSKNERS